MTDLLQQVQSLVRAGEIRVSEHGYDELADDGLSVKELFAGVADAVPVEEYPDYPKGPAILLLQKDRSGHAVHAVWGIPKGHKSPVVLVTAYRPDPERWYATFLRRR